MPDTPTQQSTGPSQYSGTVSLPNDGQILTTDEPSVQTSSLPDSTAAATPNATQGPQNPNATTTQPGQTPQPVQNQQQPNPAQKTPDLSKTPGGNNTPAAAAPTGKSQSEQRASKLYTAAESLAGGARYKYTVDANGNMQKTKIPVSLPHLGMALALEALSGAAAGLGVANGPGNLGRAAAAGFNQEAQRRQQEDQQAQKQATDDYARRAQVFETNMRTYANARAVGALDEKATDDTINNTKPHIDWLKENFPSSFEGIASYNDLSKYNATLQNALPYQKVPRMKDGQQVSVDGVPKWDMLYWVYDPSKVKGAGGINPHMQENLSKYGYSWATNPQIMNSPFSGEQVGNIGSISAGIDAFEATGKNIENRINSVGEKSPNAGLTVPDIKDGKLAQIADTAAAQFPNVPKALQRAIILNESGGNINNPDSPTGAQGVMQLIPSTAKAMGVQDPHNPVQNVLGGTKYLDTLLNQYKDPKLAAAAYYSGPGAINDKGQIVDTAMHTAADTENYVDKIVKATGLGNPSASSNTDADTKKFTLPDAAEFSKKYGTWAQDVTKFIPAFTSAKENLALTLDHLRNSGNSSAADHLEEYFGGPDNITNHDIAVETQAAQRKEDMQVATSEKKTADKQAGDNAAYDRKQAVLETLEDAHIPPNALQMDDKDLISNLKSQNVTLPPEAIRDAKAIARYEFPANIASNKLWFKDMALNQQDLLDVVRQFNPTYDVGNYALLHASEAPNSQEYKTINPAAGIANHLHQLEQAAREVASNGNGAGQFPALNALKNYYNYQSGGTDFVTLQAMTNAINGEIPKVLSGGFAPDKSQVDAVAKTMTPENSLEQITKLADMYTGVMHGKIAPLDETYNQKSGNADKHLIIPKTLTDLFKEHGYETPWEGNKSGNQQQQQNNQPQQPPVTGARAYRDVKGNIKGWLYPDGTKHAVK
jgi:hypothetical protein